MTEKVLERLNYYNGQRLEASDLKVEQEYHIRVRRWLNKSLYSAGIARGLEVRAEPKAPRVVVSPGLALDDEGHEIILWEEQRVDVVGDARFHTGTASEAEVEGLYLTIRYDEELTAQQDGGCTPRGTSHANRPASGGPSRVVAKPVFCWRAFLPHEGSGEIVLAQVELDETCSEVHQINLGVRRYVGAGSAAKVRQYALEGCRDIDDHNPQRIYFHIRGRQPGAVTLYLKSEKFPTLQYTEVGRHTHPLDITLQGGDGQHRHDLGSGHTTENEEPGHDHALAADFILLEQPDTDAVANAFLDILFPGVGLFVSYSRSINTYRVALSPQYHFDWKVAGNKVNSGDYPRIVPNDANLAGGPFRTINDGQHQHSYGSTAAKTELTKESDGNSAHTHAFGTTAAQPAGVNEITPTADTYKAYSARAGDPLTFVEGLEIWIGRENENPLPRTPEVLRQLSDAAQMDWGNKTRLGDGGGATDVLQNKGTGPIRLDFLPGIYFTEGQHFIELRVPSKTGNQPNGGRILYNLYVE